MTTRITSLEDPSLHELCNRLVELAPQLDQHDAWPAEQLELCGKYGVYEWFLPIERGGQEWSKADLIRGYLALSAACLTTTFVITQFTGACQRISMSENETAKQRLLGDLVSGKAFSTLGISHLTTSRQHLARPVLRAEPTGNGFVLDGFSPWVTGALYAQTVVIGASLEDGRQVLIVLPTDLPGVTIPPAARLVGVSASQTGELRCDRVEVGSEWVLAGPDKNVMKREGVGGNTGGLQTSTLAVGLATAAIQYIKQEAVKRPDLSEPADSLDADRLAIQADLLALANEEPACSLQQLRIRANSLVLRATQAALAAAKGTGYVVGHSAGRWCREALFFLVWSCPQPVLTANLCELAGIAADD